MKVSLSWLREYVPVEMEISELAHELTMAGLEVDSFYDRFAWLENVVVGRIVSVASHPNADKLKICKVDIGREIVSVVCGAPNVRENLLSPLALVGTVFPNDFVLKAGKIRGEASCGMLCSESELDLGTDASVIMELDRDIPLGIPLNEALGLSDMVIEIDLTPNRPDCLGILGIAREIAAIQKKRITYPEIKLPKGKGDICALTSVTIESPDHCPRYVARLIENVKVAPSPFWLKDRLISVGLRPINNIVDITNFVMMETGQPLHAFDFENLEENRIVVRTAGDGEKFVTLDGKKRTLTSDVLMICDGKKPVAIAGVMGGLNSEIEDKTSRVLIESACFDPVSIRKTAKKLGLATDASHRFERGVDPDNTLHAANRAAQLMVELGGGTLVENFIDEHPVIIKNNPVILSTKAANKRLGLELDQSKIKELLESIEFTVIPMDSDKLEVSAPSFRRDIARPEDLTEEIARLWGYNKIPVTFPFLPPGFKPVSRKISIRNRIKDFMAATGFSEVINYSFIGKDSCKKLLLKEDDKRQRLLEILNPISEDQSVMRTSLIPGLLETMGRNLARQNRNLKIFETGKVFLSKGQDKLPHETEMLAGLWTGARQPLTWYSKEIPCDFFDLKGIVESLSDNLNISSVEYKATPPENCFFTARGKTADIILKGNILGIIGELHPRVLKNYDLKQNALIFELNLDLLRPFVSDKIKAVPIPRYPSISRDLTIIVDKKLSAKAIFESVMELNEELIEDIFLFDLYEGDKIPAGKKSLSFRIIYRSDKGTLVDEDVTGIHKRISMMLLKSFNAAFPT